MKRVATDPATRAAALQLAEEVGPAEAARRTGVNAATIRSWRTRVVAPAERSAEVSAAEGGRQAKGADKAWEVAEAAMKAALAAIGRGDTLAAQRLMISAGVSVDKSGQLEEASARAAERHVRLSDAQGQVIVAAMRASFFEAVGVRVRRSAGAVIREALAEC